MAAQARDPVVQAASGYTLHTGQDIDMASAAPPDYLAIQDLSANASFLSRHRTQGCREPALAWRPKTLQGQNSLEWRGTMKATAAAVRANIRARGFRGLDDARYSQINYPLRADVYFEAGDHEQLIHMRMPDFRQLLGDATRGHFSVRI